MKVGQKFEECAETTRLVPPDIARPFSAHRVRQVKVLTMLLVLRLVPAGEDMVTELQVAVKRRGRKELAPAKRRYDRCSRNGGIRGLACPFQNEAPPPEASLPPEAIAVPRFRTARAPQRLGAVVRRGVCEPRLCLPRAGANEGGRDKER